MTGIDGRANFQGCILPALLPQISRTISARQDSKPNIDSSDDKIALHLTLHQAAIIQAQNFNGAIFGSPTSFHRTLFSGGNIEFESAHFSGGAANFNNAQFSGGDAYFEKAQFSGGDADFSLAQFSGCLLYTSPSPRD